MHTVSLRERWTAFAESRGGRIAIRTVRYAFTLAVLGYLFSKLREVGWREIWTTLPVNPLFYLFGLLVYISIPLTDVITYGKTWGHSLWFGMPAFIKKRIYNQDVLGYSGEVYFAGWAQKQLRLPLSNILRTVRDINILSSLASTLIAIALISLFLGIGHVRLTDLFDRKALMGALVAAGVLVLLIPVAIRFRRYLFAMPRRLALTVFAIQCARLLLGQALRIGQWTVAMPDVPLQVWFSLAAASLILSRIPIVPSQDLIFLGIGVEMSSMLGVSEAGMFSMLAVSSAVDKLLNLVLFSYYSVRGTGAKTP
ncbi:MAG: hypothetical protein R2834_09060 [Rhodothermales bacterium]